MQTWDVTVTISHINLHQNMPPQRHSNCGGHHEFVT